MTRSSHGSSGSPRRPSVPSRREARREPMRKPRTHRSHGGDSPRRHRRIIPATAAEWCGCPPRRPGWWAGTVNGGACQPQPPTTVRVPMLPEGCGLRARPGRPYCDHMCGHLDTELSRLEDLYRTAGAEDLSPEAWTALVAVSDAWTEFRRARGALFREIRVRRLPCRSSPPRSAASHARTVVRLTPSVRAIAVSGTPTRLGTMRALNRRVAAGLPDARGKPRGKPSAAPSPARARRGLPAAGMRPSWRERLNMSNAMRKLHTRPSRYS